MAYLCRIIKEMEEWVPIAKIGKEIDYEKYCLSE